MKTYTVQNTLEIFGDPCAQTVDTIEEARELVENLARAAAGSFFELTHSEQFQAGEIVGLVTRPTATGAIESKLGKRSFRPGSGLVQREHHRCRRRGPR